MGYQNSENRSVIMMVIGSLGAGGKERQLILHLKTLKEQQRYLTILTVLNPDGTREKEAAEYADELINIDRSFKYYLFSAFFRLVVITKKNDVKLIHSWGSGVGDLISLLVAKWCHIPFLHNGIQSSPSILNLSNKLSKLSALFADVIVANSNAGLSAFGLENHPKAMVIYNGLDLNRFAHYSISQDHDYICMVANFREEKDHKTMVRSLVDIRIAFPNILLFLVGHDFGTLNTTERLVQELELENHVKFITNVLNPEPYVAQSKVCILATHGEGISNVLLEYMALNKPIIVSNNGGNPEVVLDGVNGYLVAPQSPEALSSKVIELLKNKDLAIQMGIAGRKLVEDIFSKSKMASAFNNVYDKLQK